MAYSYTEVLVYIASLAGLERPYEESVGLGSYMGQKAVVLSKNEVDYLYQFCGRPFDKEEEEEKEEELVNFCIVVYFMSSESTVRYITIRGDGYVSKKAQNCRVHGFRAVFFVGPMGMSAPSLLYTF